MRMSGHCYRHTEEIASKLILWEPQDGQKRRGRHRISYIDNLLADTGACNTNELAKMMNDRDDRKKRVFEVKRLKRRPK